VRDGNKRGLVLKKNEDAISTATAKHLREKPGEDDLGIWRENLERRNNLSQKGVSSR